MPTALAQQDRDTEIYLAWTQGRRRRHLAEQYQCSRQAIDQAIDRARAAMPKRDRGEVFDQSLEMVDDLLATFHPLALQGDKGAGRLVDRLIGRRADLLGLTNPQKLELIAAAHEVKAEPIDIRAELQALVERIRAGQEP
jgi:hypothetical protein